MNKIEGKYVPDPNSGCWLWEGAANKQGYGSVRLGLKTISAHRLSYIQHKGEIPKGLFVLHSCDVPCCVNPNHLRLGTQSDNAKDRESRKRGKDNRGSSSASSILNEEQVLQIRSKYNPWKYTIPMLAKEYNISESTIEKIVGRISWKHI